MKKLWIFGDSYAADYGVEESWFNILGDMLGCEVVNRGLPGVDNTWIINQFQENMNDMNVDDYVITMLTDPQRFWLFENVPNLSNWYSIDKDFWKLAQEAVTKDESEAAKKFTRYLWNEKIAVTIYKMSLYYAMSHPNSRVLQNFFEIDGVKGSMIDISRNEHTGNTIEEKYANAQKVDDRPNHMSLSNHKIFAEKVYKWFTVPGTELDLTTGFEENFLTFKK
jgi:hypothetical protein